MGSIQPAPDSNGGLGRRLDEIAAHATPASENRLIDGWLCKRDPDLPFRRANAVLPALGAGADAGAAAVASALSAIEAWYAAVDRRVLIQVSSADPAAEVLDARLAARGYAVEAPVDLMIGDLTVVGERALGEAVGASGAGARVPGGAPDVAITVDCGSDPEWTRRTGDVHGLDARSNARTTGYRDMLQPLGGRALWASAVASDDDSSSLGMEEFGRPLAGVGFALADQEWMGLFGMEVAMAWRRCGVATALVGALARHGAAHGLAHRVYLQVEADNAPAQALYRRLGLARHHGYHYRVSRPWRPTIAQPVDSGC